MIVLWVFFLNSIFFHFFNFIFFYFYYFYLFIIFWLAAIGHHTPLANEEKNLTVKCKMLLQSVINVSIATIMKNLPLWMFLCVYFKYFHWSMFWCLFNIRNVTNFFNNWTNYFFTAISRDYLQNSYSDIYHGS